MYDISQGASWEPLGLLRNVLGTSWGLCWVRRRSSHFSDSTYGFLMPSEGDLGGLWGIPSQFGEFRRVALEGLLGAAEGVY